ncbi:MAG TPA: diacylglycerol kinase family protein [Bacteroidales bacterium]|nr:diacylglycerol kinase family protein [Bacteroidales bacterium]
MKPVQMIFFINPNSGGDTKTDPAEMIRSAMLANNVPFEIVEISEALDADKIRKRVKKSKAQVAVAGGGDGTVNLIASSVIGIDVKLGILPLGSANGLAYELGIPSKLEDAIEVLFTGKPTPMDAVKINDKYISLHLSDVGMNARVVKGFEEEGKRGFFAYFKHFVRVVKTPRTFKCYIETPGKTYIHKSLMTVIANSGSYRSGAVINPTGKKDDGRFEVIVLKPGRHWIVKNTIAAFTGNFHNQPNVVTYECTSVKITVRPAQELQVDGELLGKKEEVNAHIIKHALHIIVP